MFGGTLRSVISYFFFQNCLFTHLQHKYCINLRTNNQIVFLKRRLNNFIYSAEIDKQLLISTEYFFFVSNQIFDL